MRAFFILLSTDRFNNVYSIYIGKLSCNLNPSYDISMRVPVVGLKHSAARSSSGHDVREITGYSIRGFSVIEFESSGLRALIVRVTLDYMVPCANSAHFGRAICELLCEWFRKVSRIVECRRGNRLLLQKRQTERKTERKTERALIVLAT